jgi:hypothetical protein
VLRHGFNTGGVLLPSQRTARRVSPQPNRLSYTDVDFTWKDYRDHGKSKVMTLPVEEFMRLFLKSSVRIRHIGGTAASSGEMRPRPLTGTDRWPA